MSYHIKSALYADIRNITYLVQCMYCLKLHCHVYCDFMLAIEFLGCLASSLLGDYLLQSGVAYIFRKSTKSCIQPTNFTCLKPSCQEILHSENATLLNGVASARDPL